MPRHERRAVVPPHPLLAPADQRHPVIVRNFRLLRHWTQELAAEWYGVSVRSWRRYEHEGTTPPRPLMRRIATWARKTGGDAILYCTPEGERSEARR